MAVGARQHRGRGPDGGAGAGLDVAHLHRRDAFVGLGGEEGFSGIEPSLEKQRMRRNSSIRPPEKKTV